MHWNWKKFLKIHFRFFKISIAFAKGKLEFGNVNVISTFASFRSLIVILISASLQNVLLLLVYYFGMRKEFQQFIFSLFHPGSPLFIYHETNVGILTVVEFICSYCAFKNWREKQSKYLIYQINCEMDQNQISIYHLTTHCP